MNYRYGHHEEMNNRVVDVSLARHDKLAHELDNHYQMIGPFLESEWSVGAEIAQCVQGESYVKEGYVLDSGLDEMGRLLPELDRTRGDNVRYYLAYNYDVDDDSNKYRGMASGRIVTIPLRGSLYDLPAYRHADKNLYPDARMFVQSMAENENGSVVEVAALSRTNDAHPIAILEVVRQMYQDALRADSDELWMTTLTPQMYRFLAMSFGNEVVQKAGDEVMIDIDDPRTSDSLQLTPALIHPRTLAATMIDALRNHEMSTSRFDLRVRNLEYLISGLDNTIISDALRCDIAEITSKRMQSEPHTDEDWAA